MELRAQATDAVSVDADWTFNNAKYRDLVTEDTAKFVGAAGIEVAPPATELRAGGFVVPGQPRSVYGAIQYLF